MIRYRLIPNFPRDIGPENFRVDKLSVKFKKHRIQSAESEKRNFDNFIRNLVSSDGLFRRHQFLNAKFNRGFHVDGQPFVFRKSSIPTIRPFTMHLALNFSRFFAEEREEGFYDLAHYQGGQVRWHDGGPWPTHSRLEYPFAFLHGQREGLDILRDPNYVPGRRRRSNPHPHTLDWNDNYINNPHWHETGPVNNPMSFYLGLVMDQIEQDFMKHSTEELHTIAEINTRRGPSGIIADPSFMFQVEHAPLFDWSEPEITHLELYIEFGVPNAIEFMHAFAPRFRQTAQDYWRDDYFIRQQEENPRIIPELIQSSSRILESPSLTAYFGLDGTELVVYAKTRRRVRFEVRYKQSLRTLLGDMVPASVGTGEESITRLIELASHDASQRLRRFLADMPAPVISDLSFENLSVLTWKLAQHFTQSEYTNLLSNLLAEGFVTQTPENGTKLKKLAGSDGFLEKMGPYNKPSPTRYRVRPAYQSLVRAIVGQGGHR